MCRLFSATYLLLTAVVTLILVSAISANAQSQLYRPSETFPYACRLGHSRSVSVPVMFSQTHMLRALGAVLRTKKLLELQARIGKIRSSTPQVRSRKRQTLTKLRAHIKLLKDLPKICKRITNNACQNKKRDFFEDGIDCGDVCSLTCSLPTPEPTVTPSPTQTPTPEPTLAPVNNECFDGIDNNADGLSDFDDPGCLLVNAQESDTDYGFTRFHPSSDSRIVYVSSSEGDDANSGLSPSSPKRTVVAAYDLMRNDMPDWLLLKRGDTFDYSDWHMRLGRSASADPDYDFSWLRNGRSAAEPMLIGSYGTSTARPLIKQADRHGFRIWSQAYLVVTGLEFYANYCDPNSPDFQLIHCANSIILQYGNHDIVLENNKVSYAAGGFLIQSIDSGNFDRVQVRRNIIRNSYSGASHAQGLYSFGGGQLLIKDNVFYHNGWNEDYRMNLTPAVFDQSAWQTVSDGRIDVQINGVWYQLDGLNFASASSYQDVANVLQSALQNQLPVDSTATFESRGKYLILRSNLPSNENYSIRRYTGLQSGTDINGATLLNIANGNLKTPAATIFNRHMYISHNYSNTTVEGNVTAIGASGAIQVRMGGLVKNNLVLDEPVGISSGHAENPVGVPYSAVISDNVVLGSSNIGSQPRGFGLGWAAGQNSTVSHNIIAHNVRGTGNIEGLFAGTDAVGDANNPNSDSTVTNNIVYKWGGAAFSSRIQNFQNVQISQNYFLQPVSGNAVSFQNSDALLPGKLIFGGNTYQVSPSVPFPVTIASTSMSYADWATTSGDTINLQVPGFRDPERSIATYLTSIGGSGGLEEFMERAAQQDRFHWIPALSAYVVNDYIRDGFTVE